MTEIWTAIRKEPGKDGNFIVFEIKNKNKTREKRLYENALPMMFALGGYPMQTGIRMLTQPLPWQFRKIGNDIYLDGSDIGSPGYHAIKNTQNQET